MKKFSVAVLTVLTVFLFAQASAFALMDATEEVAVERITSLNQVELFDLQAMEMVNLGDLLEDKVTLIALISPQCPGCKELSSSLTVLQKFFDGNEEVSEKFQIIGIMVVPFVREKVSDEGTKALKTHTRAYFDLFADVAKEEQVGKNVKFLLSRFFVMKYPTFALVEPNGGNYNVHIVRGVTSYNEIMQLFFAFGNGFSPFLKGLNPEN